MPNNTRNVFSAQTCQIKNGNIATKEVILKNIRTPLFVLFAYGGGGAFGFWGAALHKRERLKIKYPHAEIRVIRGFQYPSQFKSEWTKLYNELTATTCKYALWEIHYFGHGQHDKLNFRESENIFFNDEENMERLPWHPYQGIFVLHSCRGGAYEDTCDKDQIDEQICLAKAISEQQETRCLGQVTYASYAADLLQFNTDLVNMHVPFPISSPVYETLPEEYVEQFKYRPHRYLNLPATKLRSGALWGYALLTGKTHSKTLELKYKYEKALTKQRIINPIYPIYEEIKKLAANNQILPCRVSNKGELETRIVDVDIFNQNDLEYI